MPDRLTRSDAGQQLLTSMALHRLLESSAAISENCRRLAGTLQAGSTERRKILEALKEARKLRQAAKDNRQRVKESLRISGQSGFPPTVAEKRAAPVYPFPAPKANAGRHVSKGGPPPDAAVLSIASAHEINNPLDSISSLLYLLEKEETITEVGRHNLELIGAEVARIAEIARVALGKERQGGSAEGVELAGLIDGVLELYRWRFESKGIGIAREYRWKGRIQVYPRRMREVFANLFLNAIDAMGRGGKLRVRTSGAREWSNGERHGVRVAIADNGQGIATKHLKSIFEPFFTTKGERGSGIGLAVVREIVQNHRGVVRVRSSVREGRSGTVFSIFLPTDAFLRQTDIAA